jgi:catalase
MSASRAGESNDEQGFAPSGEGWTDAPYTDATRDALVAKIGEQQRRVAAVPTCALGGQIGRGQHQKPLLGAGGMLTLSDAVPEALRHGPFAIPFSLPVACRFSNGQPCAFSDQRADVRGVALKVFTPAGLEADLLMTNEGGRSHAKDGESFMAFADVLVGQIEKGAVGGFEELLHELRGDQLTLGGVAGIGAVLLKEVVLHKVRSLATESYWGSVVSLGAAAFKYLVRSHGDTLPVAATAAPQGSDYLREELLSRLAQGPIKWRLCVQLFADEEHTPVKDASKAWSSPEQAIGELLISTPPSAEDERLIDQMAFNLETSVGHARLCGLRVGWQGARRTQDRPLLRRATPPDGPQAAQAGV